MFEILHFQWIALFSNVDDIIALIAHAHFSVAQMVEHGASNAKIMGSIPRENKSW